MDQIQTPEYGAQETKTLESETPISEPTTLEKENPDSISSAFSFVFGDKEEKIDEETLEDVKEEEDFDRLIEEEDALSKIHQEETFKELGLDESISPEDNGGYNFEFKEDFLEKKRVKREKVGDIDEIPKTRKLVNEMKSLLHDYPLNMHLVDSENILDTAKNFMTMYQLLVHCKEKTSKPEFKMGFEIEIESFMQNGISDLKDAYFNYYSSGSYIGSSKLRTHLIEVIKKNYFFIQEKIQTFILTIPTKQRIQLNLRGIHGLPAAIAEEYESSEMDDGAKLRPGQAFKMGDEGEIIPLED